MMQAVSCSGLTVYFDRNSGIRSSGTTVHFRKNKHIMNLRYKSAWIHYRVGGHETKCRFPALESLVLHFRNGGFHHTGIDGFHDRTGGVKPSGILNPDIYLPKYKVAIFVHGCYWHRHSGCQYAYMPKSRVEFWQKKFDDNIRRDKLVRETLENQGIRCIVVWECTIKKMQKNKEIETGTLQDLIHSIG